MKLHSATDQGAQQSLQGEKLYWSTSLYCGNIRMFHKTKQTIAKDNHE